MHTGHFGSSVRIARAWSFIDMAYPSCDIGDLLDNVYKVTQSSDKKQYLDHMKKIILKLVKHNLIKINQKQNIITDVMPYPVSSKLYVKKEFLDITKLYEQQINQFTILNKVQYCPLLKKDLENAADMRQTFARDYDALSEIDVIRTRSIRDRPFTLSKAYLIGENSLEAWEKILDMEDRTRSSLKELLDIQGKLGGVYQKAKFLD